MKIFSAIALLLVIPFSNMTAAQSKKESPLFHKHKAKAHPKERSFLMGKKAALLPDSIESYSYDPFTGQFLTSPSTYVYTYDANGNVVDEKVRTESGNWHSQLVSVYSGTLLTETRKYNWYGGNWLLEIKETVYFDAFGMDTAGVIYNFDPNGDSILDYGWRMSPTRDNLNRVTNLVFYDLDDTDWIGTERATLLYSGTETTPFEIIFEEYDEDMDAWDNSFRGTQFKWDLGFDPSLDEGPSVYLGEEWNGSAWEKTEYDSNVVVAGRIMEYLSYGYDDVLEIFELNYSEEYQYDANGSAIVSLELQYNAGIADTISITLDTFTYGSSAEILTHIRMSETLFSPYPFGYKEVYYYANTSLVAPAASQLKVYPNPVVSGQTIQLAVEEELQTLSLFDTKGKLVKTWNDPSADGLSTAGLTPGIYFLRAVGANGHYTGRLSIQ